MTEFYEDGKVVENVASGEPIHGRYSLNGETLKINIEGVAEELSFSAALKQDTLEMRDSDGQVSRYRRVG